MDCKSTITAERLRKLLDYDRVTGLFRWLVSHKRIKAGAIAGYQRPDGYVIIKVDGESYVSQRLAWLWIHGAWPSEEIDHENLVKSDNSFDNLRDATHAQNQANRQGRSACGFKGVHFDASGKRRKRWTASIRKDGTLLNLGRFATAEEAHARYVAAGRSIFGEFARAA